jgi:hypothetical protein
MKRILLVMSVAALMAAMLALMAVPAFATVHELANAECATDEAPADDQSPPGLTPAQFGGTGKSQGSPPNNPFNSTLAQPVFAVYDNPSVDTPSDGASHNALRDPAPPLGEDFGPHPGTQNCVNN